MRCWYRKLIAQLGLGLALTVGIAVAAAHADWHAGAPKFSGTYRDFSVLENPRELPAHELVGPDGAATDLSVFRGKVVLVNFWATWCPPCVKEMPSLDNLQAQRGGEHFEVVAISIDRKRDLAANFLEEKGLEHLALFTADMGKTMKAFRVGALPTSLIISPEGKILGAIAGDAEWDGDKALAFVDYFIRHAK
jgi:thiol-disulfide isomerase/thioredoxin